MHIVMLVISVLGAGAGLIWWLGRAAEGARNVADAAGELRNLPRKHRFTSKSRKQGIEIIDDSREAATLLLLTVARESGEVTVEQKREISRQMQAHFSMDPEEAGDMLHQISWLSANSAVPSNVLGRMMDVLRRYVGKDELSDLHDMMSRVARAEGEPTRAQRDFMNEFQRRAGLI